MNPKHTPIKHRALIIISLFLVLTWTGQAFGAPDKRVDTETLTKSLVGLDHAYRKAGPAAKSKALQQLVDKAEERKALLTELMESDPASVLRVAIPAHVRARMPARVQALIERHVDIEGELEIEYEDYRDGTHRLRHSLKIDDGPVSLYFKAAPAGLLSGTPVRVSGVLLDDEMAVESGENDILVLALGGASDGVASSGAADPAPNAFGDQRVLVMLVNFQDNPVEPYTTEFARSVFFNETSDFFLENSFGQTWLSGDVTGWHTIPVDSSTCDNSIRENAEQAAINAGFNPSGYARLVYAFPNNSACGYWGAATLGGVPSRANFNGDLELEVTGHELGHNLGLYHGHSMTCDEGVVIGSGSATAGLNPWPSCSSLEYGDGVDIMGSSISGHFSAYQKERLGWLGFGTSPPITQVIEDGIYEIYPFAAAPDNTPRALKILKAEDSWGYKTWYYLEYRQPIGYDSIFNSFYSTMDAGNVYNGVTVHTAYDGNGGNSLFLLDMTPETNLDLYTKDPALLAGRTFVDPDGIVTMTTDLTDTNGALVSISLAQPVCKNINPDINLSPSVSPWVEAGTTVTFSLTLTNMDSSACSAVTYDISASVPTGWNANVGNSSVTLDPGSTNTTTLEVTSSTMATDDFYDVTVDAANASNPIYAASGQVTYVVSNPVPNQAPIALADNVSTAQDTGVLINVLANDSDPDGDLLIVETVTQGVNGHATINPDGSLAYMPDAGYSGKNYFSYRITDGNNGSASATVSVDVIAAPTNQPPLAVDDAVTILDKYPVTIDVIANDSDPDANALTMLSVTQGAMGTVSMNAGQTVTYTPGKRFKNGDNFTYTITDGLSSATATVQIALQKTSSGKGGGKPGRK